MARVWWQRTCHTGFPRKSGCARGVAASQACMPRAAGGAQTRVLTMDYEPEPAAVADATAGSRDCGPARGRTDAAERRGSGSKLDQRTLEARSAALANERGRVGGRAAAFSKRRAHAPRGERDGARRLRHTGPHAKARGARRLRCHNYARDDRDAAIAWA